MIERTLPIDRMENVINVFGSFDQNLRIIENELGVRVTDRDDQLRISGEPEDVMTAEKAINGLLQLASRGEAIDAQNVRYILKLVSEGREAKISELSGDVVCITAKGKPIKAKTLGQKAYVDAMNANTITLGIGPAGTGKTYLAVAEAVAAFRSEKVNRIILTRTCARSTTRSSRCSGRRLTTSISSAATSRSRRSRTCAAARWTTASSSSTRRRTPRANR